MNIHDFQYHVDALTDLNDRLLALVDNKVFRDEDKELTELFYGTANLANKIDQRLEIMQEEINDHLKKSWWQKLQVWK